MLEYEESPPPLHHSPAPSAPSPSPSRDTTPVTPLGAGLPSTTAARRADFDKELVLPWFKRPIDVGRTTTSLCLETTPLQPDFDDASFPQFGASPPVRGMASAAVPTTIATRQTSTSPRGPQSSTLTSALQKSHDQNQHSHMDHSTRDNTRPPVLAMDSSSDMAQFERGARPITVKDKGRRESIAQSLGTGMSWGGISVGSWIRDDMMMSGTSPFAFHQSPSYHSSSYLPKLEANFMRDFSCCGLTLPTLHDLLQHYEEAHAQKDPVQPDAIQQPQLPDSRAAVATSTANQIQHEAQQRVQSQQQQQNGSQHRLGASSLLSQGVNQQQRNTGFANTLQTIPDMDTVDDMEMDDMDDIDESTPPPNLYTQAPHQASPQLAFASAVQPLIPQLSTNMMQGHQTYRNSTPSTPVAPGRTSATFQGPNASSTLMANPMQQFQDLQNPYRNTPESSAPGTPGELDESLMSGMDDMSMQNQALFGGMQNGFGGFGGFGTNNDMIDLCIDEPAKRLFTPGHGNTNSNLGGSHQRLGSAQYGPNSEIAKRIREQQMLAGLPDTTTNMLPHEEPKPFRCPVIGCEKAYKNQNGLKYHKSHGHNNQRLHDNADGTFSIVNPDTQAPYPGTMGMEKEKPYKCDVCQKRYKNLNGLKYHKTHSPPCNPDLQGNSNGPPSAAGGIPNLMGDQHLNMGKLGLAISGEGNMR